MSHVWSAALPEIAKGLNNLLAAWRARDERRAVKDAEGLGFWPDGMVHELRIIADGKATPETIEKLKQKFEDSEEPAQKLMQSLLHIRGKLTGHRDAQKIIQQINAIVLHDGYGKGIVRQNIKTILNKGVNPIMMQNEAKLACNSIDTLNAEIAKLGRIVYDS